MNYNGWLRFHRKQWGNWISEDKPFCKGYAWTYLYSEANWEDEIWAKENVKIKRGQLPTSVNKLAQNWGWSRGKVNTFLTRLKNDRMIDIEKTIKYIVVTIINYELYQSKEGEPDTNLTQKRHKTLHTIRSKEVKNIKRTTTTKQKQKINFDFDKEIWENITDKDIVSWSNAYPACRIDLELKQMEQWLLSNPDKKKSRYRRFITNWLIRSQDKGGTKGLVKDNIDNLPNLMED